MIHFGKRRFRFRNPKLSGLRTVPRLISLSSNKLFGSMFGQYENFGAIDFYPLGRDALKEALNRIDRKGQTVHVPALICKEVPDAIRASGYKVRYYQVSRELTPPPQLLNYDLAGQIVLVVHYFGFPMAADSIEALKRAGAVVIEDNAHGIFSSQRGRLLGTNGDYGVFSFRKNLGLNLGALLLDCTKKEDKVASRKQQKQEFPFFSKHVLKSIAIRELQQKAGWKIWSKYRKFRANRIHSTEVEKRIDSYHLSKLELLLLHELMNRSSSSKFRDNYENLVEKIQPLGFRPLFKLLPEGTVPLGLPVWSPNPEQDLKKLEDLGLEVYRWPELPKEVLESTELQSLLPLNSILILPYQ